MRVRLSALLLVVLATMLLAACGDDEAQATDDQSGVTTRLPTPRPEATPAPRPEPSEAELEWAREFCEATAEFDALIESLEDGVDPRSLDLEARRDRGVMRYERHVEGLGELQDALQEMTPAPEAQRYHGATIEQTQILTELISGSIDFLSEVESHEAMEEELEMLVTQVQVVADAVAAIAGELPPETREALRLAPRCGSIIG